MARRGRAIATLLGLLVVFIWITSRNSGSHPRDLRVFTAEDLGSTSDALRSILKEPPGKWDPVADKFTGHTKNTHFEMSREQLDIIANGGADMPDAGVRRKEAPKKTSQIPLNPEKISNDEKGGIDPVNTRKTQKTVTDRDETLVPEEEKVQKYDPAEGDNRQDPVSHL